MAEEGKVTDGNSSGGADWEVVSLTASAYAAAPGPVIFDPPSSNVESTDKELDKVEKESYDQMIMSRHFTLAPDEYKGIDVGTKCSDIHGKIVEEDILHKEKEDVLTGKSLEECYKTKPDDNVEEIHSFQKEKSGSVGGISFGECKELQEQIVFGSPELSAFHAETNASFHCKSGADFPDYVDLSQENEDPPPESDNASVYSNEDDGYDFPCKEWLKKRAVALYNHTKEANTFWSVVVAAALVGVVILGHYKRKERSQLEQFKVHVSINDERTSSMLGPLNRFKSIITGDHQLNSLSDGGARLFAHGAS